MCLALIYKQLTIFGWGWAKYRDLSVASRSIKIKLICKTRTNHNILWWPSLIDVLPFDHWVCLFFFQSWTTLHMSRPLFAEHVLESPPMKRKKNLQNDNNNYWMLENIIWKCAILLKACSWHRQCFRYLPNT